jgi:parallel beta-helix repeat protein
MLKGISTIIEIILIIIIVVALIALLWLFGSGLFTSTTASSEVSFNNTVYRMRGCLRIENVNPTTGEMTLRNCGYTSLSNCNVFVDNSQNIPYSGVLNPGDTNSIALGLSVGVHDVFVSCDNAESLHKTIEIAYAGAPQWSNYYVNSTLAGSTVLHSLKWTDNAGLSGYIFSFDNCVGTLSNVTWTNAAFSETSAYSNVTKLITSTSGCIIHWKVYANDTYNKWGISPTFFYTTSSGGGGSFVCGNGVCDSGEDQYSCSQDCGYSPTYCNFHIQSLSDTYSVDQSNKVYCLDNNVHIDGKDAIDFVSGVQNTTLDCLGSNIDGNKTSSTYGVYLTGSSTLNNTIKNCNVTNFDNGIYIESSNNNTFFNNIANNNTRGFYLLSSSNYNTLSNNTANYNIWHGFNLFSSSNNTLMNNIANYNAYYGFILPSSSNNTLINNTANYNTQYGFNLLSSSNYNTLSNNIANNNIGYGFILSTSSNNTLMNNIANYNNVYGIILWTSSNNTLINNIANYNTQYGFYLFSSSKYNTLSNNTANYNNNYGFYLDSGSINNTLYNNIANYNTRGFYLYSGSNNTLINNIANSNSNYGFVLSSSSNYNTLSNNIANNNIGYGFYLYTSSNNTLINNIANNNNCGIRLFTSSNNTLVNNTANYNTLYGFYLYSGSNNTLTGGSILLSSIVDYYLGSAGTTNKFANTNFTAARKIEIYDSDSWFNYRNDTSNLWLKTNVSASTTLTRKLINWNQNLMQWNDTSNNVITAGYNVSGLLTNTNYSVYNNTLIPTYTINSSLQSEINFTIYLPLNQQINITVQKV